MEKFHRLSHKRHVVIIVLNRNTAPEFPMYTFYVA